MGLQFGPAACLGRAFPLVISKGNKLCSHGNPLLAFCLPWKKQDECWDIQLGNKKKKIPSSLYRLFISYFWEVLYDNAPFPKAAVVWGSFCTASQASMGCNSSTGLSRGCCMWWWYWVPFGLEATSQTLEISSPPGLAGVYPGWMGVHRGGSGWSIARDGLHGVWLFYPKPLCSSGVQKWFS